MSMRLKIGSRVFAPRWFTSIVTLMLLALLVNLGRWQLHRADEKRALFRAFAEGSDSTRTLTPQTPAFARYQHLEAAGHYDSAHQLLLDNMIARDGRAGFFVITPFALDTGQWLLVNRGWVPLGATRDDRPAISVEGAERTIRGRTDFLPRPGIRLGTPAPLDPPFPIVANYPTLSQVRAALKLAPWSPAAQLVLLDAGEPDGFRREWQAPGFAPERHVAYAVTWFGLAAALAVIYLINNLRP